MARTSNTYFTVAIIGVFLSASLYAVIQRPMYTENQAVYTATQFLRKSPTYSFDGIEESIELLNIDTLRTPYTWSITLGSTSRNAGYGDRSDIMVATVLTEHTMVIIVSQGEITSAVTDGAYNELTSSILEMNQVDDAEELALTWLMNSPTFSFNGIEGSMVIIETVVAESYPEQYYITINFTCAHPGYGDRTGEVLAQVITPHTALVIVSAGEVRSAVIDGEWNEFIHEQGTPDILSSEEAVNIAVQYLREQYTEASNLEIGPEWSVANLTPEGIVGFVTIEYSGDGWIITVSYPVVWKPTYSIDVENSSGFIWSGTVNQDGVVTE